MALSTEIPNAHPNYRPDIDGLRAVAVLLVVLFHAFPGRLPGGFIGVDIFFVISGYLISSIIYKSIDNGHFSFGDFYIRRIKRILPALILVLLTCLLLGLLLMLPQDYKELGKQVAGSVAFVANFVLLKESGYFDISAELKPLLHIWSLSIEEQFYVVWPLLLLGCRCISRNRLFLLGILFLLSMAINVHYVSSDREVAFYLPLSRAWELLAGALLAHAAGLPRLSVWFGRTFPGRSARMADASSVAGAALIVAGVCLIDDTRLFPGYWALLPVLGACMLISANSQALVNRKLLSHPAMVFVGLVSYPLYLWHWPLLSFMRYAGAAERPLVRAAAIAVSIGLAWLTYRFVERPVRSGKQHEKMIVISLLLLILTAGAAGLFVYRDDGLISRYPPNVRTYLMYDYDYARDFRNGKCLLSGEQVTFSEECVETTSVRAGLPLTLIWGDSHGAQLFRSIEALHTSASFSLAQFTSSSCPPLIDFEKKDRPHCGSLNREIQSAIQRLRPQTVILAHDWPQSLDQSALAKLPATVAFLRANGVRRIVLVGPVPHWEQKLPTIMYRYLVLHHTTVIPERMNYGLNKSISGLDQQLAVMATQNGIIYISPYSAFCNQEGCLTSVDPLRATPTAFDNAHLSREAAAWFINKVKTQLIGQYN